MNNIIRSRPLLGTFVEIGTGANENQANKAITAAFSAIEKIQTLLSFQDADSELSRFNRSRGKYVELHPLSLRVLRLALDMTRCSKNLFNCTIGGALVEQGVLPNHSGQPSFQCGTADDVEINGQKARLLSPILITLDGIAKGYAVDHAVRIMQQCGLATGWVNAGGDMRVFGHTVLPVQRRELDNYLTVIGQLHNAALATSCIKQECDPRFPGRIVTGNAGKPGYGVWTVLARHAWRADALTKIAALSSGALREKRVAQLGGKLLMNEFKSVV